MKRRRPGRRDSQAMPGRVRIVAGKWRGRFLDVADAPDLRPTSARIRETLFNWLAPTISGARCLDLFAGSGVLGVEALSRGAASVVFVERSPGAASTLEAGIARLGGEDAAVHVCDAFEWLQRKPAQRFDVVFLDPPYALESLTELCRLLAADSWLAAGAFVYMEQDIREDRPRLPDHFDVWREKTAGNVRYTLVRTRTHEGE